VSGQQHAPAALYPRERPGTLFTGGWVSPRAGLDERKISSPPGFDSGPSSPSHSRYTDWANRPTYIYNYIYIYNYTVLFETIVGVLTTAIHNTLQIAVYVFFYLIEQHSKFLLHTLQVLYMCTLCDSTNINTIIEFVPNWQVVKTPTIISNNPVYYIISYIISYHTISYRIILYYIIHYIIYSIDYWNMTGMSLLNITISVKHTSINMKT